MRAGSPFLPTVAAPREQVIFGHVRSLTRTGARYTMRFDPAMMLTGTTAAALAEQTTGSSDVPNDYLVFDPEHRLLTYPVRSTARVTIVVNPGTGITSRRITVAQLARIVAGRPAPGVKPFEPANPFWVVVAGDTAVELDQQYTP